MALAALINLGVYSYAYNDEELFNAILLAIVIIASGSMVYVESGKGESILDSYGGIEEGTVEVIRNDGTNEGRRERIPAAELVCGDIVVNMVPTSTASVWAPHWW